MSRKYLKFEVDMKSLFPTEIGDAVNYTIYTKEAVDKAMKSIEGIPFVAEIDGTEKPIGVVTSYEDGLLWVEMYPEISMVEYEVIKGYNVVDSFSVNGIMMKL